MKLRIPLKIHFYGLQFLYFLFVLIVIGFFLASYFVTKESVDYVLSLLFFSNFIIFGFLIGVKEYTTVSKSYLSVQINKKLFFQSSLFFGLLHTILYLLLILLFFGLQLSTFSFDIVLTNPFFIPASFFFFYIVYLIGNLYGLVLYQSKLFHWLFVAFLIIIAVIITITYQEIILFFEETLLRFLVNDQYLTLYSGIASFILGILIIAINQMFYKKQV